MHPEINNSKFCSQLIIKYCPSPPAIFLFKQKTSTTDCDSKTRERERGATCQTSAEFIYSRNGDTRDTLSRLGMLYATTTTTAGGLNSGVHSYLLSPAAGSRPAATTTNHRFHSLLGRLRDGCPVCLRKSLPLDRIEAGLV